MRNMMQIVWGCLLCGLALGCADAIEPANAAETPAIKPAAEPAAPEVKPTNLDDSLIRINSSDEKLWTYFDFETQTAVIPQAAEEVVDWDIAFQRYTIKLNPGSDTAAAVTVLVLDNADFDKMTKAPQDGYQKEMPKWYDYNPVKHTLTPKDQVFIFKTADSGYFKVKFTTYYDAAGTSGHPTFQWAEIEAQDSHTDSPGRGSDL